MDDAHKPNGDLVGEADESSASTAPSGSSMAPMLVGVLVEDRYRLRDQIHEGPGGWVFAAQDERTEEAVSLLLVRRWRQEPPDGARRLHEQIRAAGRIHSDHVVRVLESGVRESGHSFVVMEPVERTRTGPLPWEEVRPMILDLGAALTAVDDVGIVLSGLSPDMIFQARGPGGESRTKLLVLDLVGRHLGLGSKVALHGVELESLRYLTPECLLGHRAGRRAHVYAVGLSLLELVTGTHPWSARNPATFFERPDGAAMEAGTAEVLELLPLPLRSIVARALRSDPEERFASAAELVAALP